jgi:hypothetical protein
MPKYKVRVQYEYPVDAVSAEDALKTVPIASRLNWINAEGLTEIFNAAGEKVLTAKLVTKQKGGEKDELKCPDKKPKK